MVISSSEIFGNETLYEGLVLELSTKHAISKQALHKLTKTKVLFPQDIEGMMERVYALVILSKLFFGDQSLLVQNLQVFSLQCQKKKLLLKTAKHLDDQFIAKFLFSIDNRINKWLNECQKAKIISNTSLELINFSIMISDIQLNRFICYLPNNIKKMTKKENSEDDDDIVSPSKRNRSNTNSNNNTNSSSSGTQMIINDHMENDLKKKPSENWNKIFKNNIRKGPTISVDTHACLKFHVKGICYEDCRFKSSHIKLTGDDLLKTKDFVKKLRDEA